MSPDSISGELAKLVRREQAAESLQEQVSQLYEEAREDVYRYLLTLGLYPPQAQEATQEVFLRLYATLRKGEAVRNTRAWVFRVAHNLGLTLRLKQHEQAPFAFDLEQELATREPDPEQNLLRRERLLRFHRAVEGLSEQQRRCLHLRLEGLRYPEIAAALGISASAVGEFLRRALARLRKVQYE